MYVTEADRARIWQAWIADPAGWMTRFAKRGDQAVLEQVIPDCQVWQDVRPGRFVSFRKHIRNKGLNDPPAGVGVVVFHGKPRPWKVWLQKGWPFFGRPKWIPPL